MVSAGITYQNAQMLLAGMFRIAQCIWPGCSMRVPIVASDIKITALYLMPLFGVPVCNALVLVGPMAITSAARVPS